MFFENNTDFFDQHFLINESIIQKFINEANLTKDDIVVEVGPGKGQISQLIAKKVKKLYCIELDERLKPFLKRISDNNPNVEIIFGSILDLEIPKCTKIVTSLPYSIVEPFINKLISCEFEEALMITGAKFANNVIKKNINKLSILTNCYFSSHKIMDIIPESFKPAPRVMSSMIRLVPIKKEEIDLFELSIFRYMFYFKDKKVKNGLSESLIKFCEDKYQKKLSKRNSAKLIDILSLSNIVSDKKFEICSNGELKEIYSNLKKIETIVPDYVEK